MTTEAGRWWEGSSLFPELKILADRPSEPWVVAQFTSPSGRPVLMLFERDVPWSMKSAGDARPCPHPLGVVGGGFFLSGPAMTGITALDCERVEVRSAAARVTATLMPLPGVGLAVFVAPWSGQTEPPREVIVTGPWGEHRRSLMGGYKFLVDPKGSAAVVLLCGDAAAHAGVARQTADYGQPLVVVSTDAEGWAPLIAGFERAALMVGDPTDGAVVEAAEEMARELFQVDDVEAIEAEIHT